MNEALSSALAGFEAISLEDMEILSLQRRSETKYLVPESLVPALLIALTGKYTSLEIYTRRSFLYTTAYYDTPGFDFYLDHQNGRAGRIKVRCRSYEHSGDTFFEVKQKLRDGRTQKIRRSDKLMYGTALQKAGSLLQHPRLEVSTLEYVLTTSYKRITLCAKDFSERITIDTDLAIMDVSGSKIPLTDAAIIELKQTRTLHDSPALCWLKAHHIHATSFSKYVTGIALLYPHLKHNIFKPGLRRLAQLHSDHA